MNQPGNGITALMTAASRGDLARVETLLTDAALHVDAQDVFGNTALIYAAGAGHAEIVAALVLAGANVTLRNRAGHTGLDIATHRGYAATAQTLKQARLCCAARDGDLALIAEMLAHGADVNAQLTDGWTALMIAAYHDQPDAVITLLAHGADAAQETVTGRTASTIAAGLNHHECYRLLTQHHTAEQARGAFIPAETPPSVIDITDFADAEHPDN